MGVLTMTLVSLVVLGMFLRQARQHALQREALTRQVLAERDHLEAEVALRTAELLKSELRTTLALAAAEMGSFELDIAADRGLRRNRATVAT